MKSFPAVPTVPAGDPASILNRGQRSRGQDRLASGSKVDVLIVGGGITGTGAALDAASRGLSVALVERADLASGTSSASSKLVHGGLRYLAKGDVAVAWESAAERAILADRVAPHLIHRLGQLVPIFEGNKLPGYLSGGGFIAGDLLRHATRTPRGLLKGTRRLSTQQALELAPVLRQDGLLGAVLGWDCQLEDDARLVVAVARTAAAFGATILTHTRAVSLNPGGESVLEDALTGETWSIRADNVINATGVWAHSLDPTVQLSPSVGTHLVLRSEVFGNSPVSITVPVPGALGRFVFTLPQTDGRTYVGLTDTPLEGDAPDSVTPLPGDVLWLTDIVSTVLEAPIDVADVLGTFTGMRPLVAGTDAKNQQAPTAEQTGHPLFDPETPAPTAADISRRHLVTSTDGLTTVTGGKLTTYRRMASDAIDQITDVPCRTKDIGLIGSGEIQHDSAIPARLYRRYGTEAPLVWSQAVQDPALRRPLVDGNPTIAAELTFGSQFEGAMTSDDLLNRRTRLGLVDSDAEGARPAAEQTIGQQIASGV